MLVATPTDSACPESVEKFLSKRKGGNARPDEDEGDGGGVWRVAEAGLKARARGRWRERAARQQRGQDLHQEHWVREGLADHVHAQADDLRAGAAGAADTPA